MGSWHFPKLTYKTGSYINMKFVYQVSYKAPKCLQEDLECEVLTCRFLLYTFSYVMCSVQFSQTHTQSLPIVRSWEARKESSNTGNHEKARREKLFFPSFPRAFARRDSLPKFLCSTKVTTGYESAIL